MKQINLTTSNLGTLFSTVRNECLSNDMGDGAYEVTHYRESYPDESVLAFSTFLVKDDTEPEFIHSVLNEVLPDEAKNEDHLIFTSDFETLELHYNDSTITLIYHHTGEF